MILSILIKFGLFVFIQSSETVTAAYRKACSTGLSFGREQSKSFSSEMEQLSDLYNHNDVPHACLNKISRQIEAQGSFIAHQPFQFNFKGSNVSSVPNFLFPSLAAT